MSLASGRHPPWGVPQGLGHCPAQPQRLPGPQPPAEGGREAQALGTARVRRARARLQGWGKGAGEGAPSPGSPASEQRL